MRALWRDEVAQFDGEHVQLPPSWAWPKPVQQPYPPVYLGGNGPRSMRQAAGWADAWYPTSLAGHASPAAAVAAFGELVEQAGRDPAAVPVGLAPGAVTRAELASYRDAGLERVDVAVVAGSDGELLRSLDSLASLRDAVI
jgi:alkanesulfonate monooxygenase SsuD/methylene tetrahydromethanopterin reductase-like flavin-dependent oxidoreductase (luciferase family)